MKLIDKLKNKDVVIDGERYKVISQVEGYLELQKYSSKINRVTHKDEHNLSDVFDLVSIYKTRLIRVINNKDEDFRRNT